MKWHFLSASVPLLIALLHPNLVGAKNLTEGASAKKTDRRIFFHSVPQTSTCPITGKELASMKGFDKKFVAFLQDKGIPGAALTVAYKGKLVFSRGYGFANKEKKEPVLPTSLFRVASLSKSITAIGILALIEKGKLSLDQRAFDILTDLKPCDPEVVIDPRISTITIRDLLQCSAGWSEANVTDVIFGNGLYNVTHSCSNTLRPTNTAIIRYLLNCRLDYDPGSSYVYSNVAYCVLGAIIEKVSGQKYNEFIDKLILKPTKLNNIEPGLTLTAKKNEVTYYPVEESSDCIVPNVKGPVSAAYGALFMLEAAPATIGWIASTEDLVRLGSIVSGEQATPSPINKQTTALMFARPELNYWKEKPEYFAFGWEVERDSKGNLLAFSRHGSLQGSMALIEHQANGISWAAGFNSRPLAYEPSREEVKALIISAIKDSLVPSLR